MMIEPQHQEFAETNEALEKRLREDRLGAMVILTRTGSRAYGTDHADSDHDFRGVYQASDRTLFSLRGAPQSIDISEPHDAVLYEVQHFVQLAAKANPTALEILWGDDFDAGPVGEHLRANRSIFATRVIERTYGGYAMSQIRKAKEGTGGSRGAEHHKRDKFRLHTLRLLMAGAHALETGEVMVRVPDPEALWEMARSDVWEAHATILKDRLDKAAEKSDLPESPDIDSVNDLLYDIRKDYV